MMIVSPVFLSYVYTCRYIYIVAMSRLVEGIDETNSEKNTLNK